MALAALDQFDIVSLAAQRADQLSGGHQQRVAICRRSATIIGIVGAGGIGLHLSEQIRTLEWQNVSFLILMILATVAMIDFISARLRFAIIGERAKD